MPVIQVDAVHDNAHGARTSRSVMMAPRSPARRRTVSSKRRACVLSMFSHIAGNEAKHKSVFHGTEPHPQLLDVGKWDAV